MKTIYNVKALCVVALLGSAAAASAQEPDRLLELYDRRRSAERD